MDDRRENTPSFAETSRRDLLLVGAAAAAAVAAPSGASAQRAGATTRPFAGKVVLITGATSGIGRATAVAFARAGASVAFCGRRRNMGAETERLVREAGGQALYVPADVRDEAQVGRFVAAALDRFGGRIDVAFNNAGIGGPQARTHEVETATWTEVMDTNLRGMWHAMRAELPIMQRQRAGVIVNTASVLGEFAVPGVPAYNASKHAVIGLTKTAALEYAKDGIRINAVAPGPIDTRLLAEWNQRPGAWDRTRSNVPQGRIGRPEEVADAVLALASSGMAFVSGAVFAVDGGILAGRGGG